MTVHGPDEATALAALPLRHALRRATRVRHEALDGEYAAMLERLDYLLYRRFIRMNHCCHGAVEAALEDGPILAWLPDWPGWSRRPDLDHDMAAMALEPFPAPPFEVATRRLPEAVGTAYVLEGSRVGALYIHRRFIEANVKARWPGASLNYVAGSQGDDRFRTFMDMLPRLDFSPQETLRCFAAANTTFKYFMTVSAAVRSHADPGTERM